MINGINKTGKQGQTALILILLTAVALIFLAININWGRVAQTKSLLTIAADQSAALLASDAASYGEMEKQTYLGNVNRKSEVNWKIVIGIIVIIIAIVITICTWGATTGLLVLVVGVVGAEIVMVLAIVMAIVSLVLQLAVIDPMMANMWNSMQKNQTVQQQFYEQGLGTALMGSVTDQISVTDYFDLNTNGKFGYSTQTNSPNDTINRFAFFYTDRLKMLNQGDIAQVVFFYGQLMEFLNGATCAQNYADNQNYPGVPLNPSCLDPGSGTGSTDFLDYCVTDPSDPSCQGKPPSVVNCTQNLYEDKYARRYMPSLGSGGLGNPPQYILSPNCPGSPNNPDVYDCSSANPTDPACQMNVSNAFSFQLTDSCVDGDPASPTYNPSCDACCQPWSTNTSTDPTKPTYKHTRPSGCAEPAGFSSTTCGITPNKASCACNLPDNPTAQQITDYNNDCIPPECTKQPSNPYVDSVSSYPYLYDSSYQEYSNGLSFLDQFGRDQPMIPSGFFPALPSTKFNMTVYGNFPNGIYPFFWLMKEYSPQVDNIDPTVPSFSTATQYQSQYHWCVSQANGGPAPTVSAPAGFADLDQLTLPYICSGQDCCTGFLPNSTASPSALTSPPVMITVSGAAVSPTGPSVCVVDNTTAGATTYTPGDCVTVIAAATGSGNVTFQITGGGDCVTDPLDPVCHGTGTSTTDNTTATTLGVVPLSNGTAILSFIIPTTAKASPVTSPVTYVPTPAASYTLTATAPNGAVSSVTMNISAAPPCSGTCSAPSAQTCTGASSCPTTPGGGATAAPNAHALIVDTNPKTTAGTTIWKEEATAFTGGAAPSFTLTVTATDANGSSVPLTPSVSDSDTLTFSSYNVPASVTGISYYYAPYTAGGTPACSLSTTLIGSSTTRGPNTTGPSYIFSGPNGIPPGNYCLTASVPSAGVTGTNGVIDLVGDPSISTSYANNPAFDDAFGETIAAVPQSTLTAGGTTYTYQSTTKTTGTWEPGDNQMCVATWQYNGQTAAYPDGTCEWSDSVKAPLFTAVCASGTCDSTGHCPNGAQCTVSTRPDTQLGTDSTIDGLDDTMHTLSDFLKFSQNLLQKDVGSLSSTFDSWFPTAAQWIAPQCPIVTYGPGYDWGKDPQLNGSTCQASTDPNCVLPDYSCNTGSNGRLLNIYEPVGYPGFPTAQPPGYLGFTVTPSNFSGPTVDVLQNWNLVITEWLNNVYTTPAVPVPPATASPQPWCVPPMCSTGMCSDAGKCSDGSSCVPQAEENYINANSSTPTWGDLAHVSACLDYNAGWSPHQSAINTNNFSDCLEAMNTTPCPPQLPAACDLTSLGVSVESAYGGACDDGSKCGAVVTNTCKDGSPCSMNGSIDNPYACKSYYINSGTSTPANPVGVPSFAKWVSDSIDFGVVHNYKQCLDLLQNMCPASLTGTVCDPAILGRDLLPPTAGQAYIGGRRTAAQSATDCDPAQTGYAKWVQDSINMFSNENNKFLRRAQFVSDLYTRATSMQNIITQGDVALHNFFKPCGPVQISSGAVVGGCADGTTCLGSKCDDNSACGPPTCASGGLCQSDSTCPADGSSCNYCANGGPAAQLLYRRNLDNFPTASLPNSVIYGWKDRDPSGGSGGCVDSTGARVGCAHIVKATAYAPGRVGNAPASLHIQPELPWIYMFTSWEWWCSPLGGCPFIGPPVGIPWLNWVLNYRDGYVYVSIKRWDQNHATGCSNGGACVNGKCSSDGSACGGPLSFPNQRPLWQMMFNNPSPSAPTPPPQTGLPSTCIGVNPPPPSDISSLPQLTNTFGYGLQTETSQALSDLMVRSDPTVGYLGQAFMLNDNGNGQVDPNAKNGGKACTNDGAPYCTCLAQANELLNTGTVSYACAEYIAWRNASESSPAGVTGVYEQPSTFSFNVLPPGSLLAGKMAPNPAEHDYSLKFVDCNTLLQGATPPEDLTTSQDTGG